MGAKTNLGRWFERFGEITGAVAVCARSGAGSCHDLGGDQMWARDRGRTIGWARIPHV